MKKINVVISTNKSQLYIKKLKKLVNQILRQKGNFKIKIIIIHQFQEKKTILKFRRALNKKKIYYRNIKKENLSISKNLAMKISKSDFITFLDDDVEIKKDYFLRSYINFSKTKCDALFSRLGILNSKKSFLNGANKKNTWINYFNTRSCLSTTFWIKNHYKLKINFDKNFGLGSTFGSGEETDFIFQMLKKKKKIFYSGKISVFHPEEFESLNNSKNVKDKFFSYGQGQGALYKKHLFTNNNLFIILFIISILKSILGIVVYSFFLDSKKITKYLSMFNGKINGFINYKL